ncbi:hypothetical protein [Actinomadura sp. NPDC048394]|uniref:hypothetical protein n=1 Tax=Actinomadura sp. NPDC048394 TaxID=3158223 RepID=UPI0033D2F6A4
MQFRIARILGGAMALTTAAIMATAGNASATTLPPASGGGWEHVYSATGVKVYVKEHGDQIKVCDTSANGHAAIVKVNDITENSHHGHAYTAKDKTSGGPCVIHTASQGGAYNLYEGDEYGLFYVGNGGRGHVSTFVNDH